VTTEQKLLLDEMLSGDVAGQLRAKGHDVIAVVEDPALVGTPDEELLAHATASGRWLVTANVRDFATIHASWGSRGRSHAGLIYLVNRVFPSDRSFVGAIVTALDDMIVAEQLPADGAEAYLRRHRP
jgi:predicted nuclease of predicted toxin-antitoxin system